MHGETHNLYDFTGKAAIVTGGGSGLGQEFCGVLAEYGADVACPDLYKERADETCKIIKKYGHKTLTIKSDLSKYDHVQAMFKQVMDNFGRVDILVNNAGISAHPAPIGQVDLEDWHNVINIDLHGVFYCMQVNGCIFILRNSSIAKSKFSDYVKGCQPIFLNLLDK